MAALRTKNLCLVLSIDLLESANHNFGGFVNAPLQLFLNAKIYYVILTSEIKDMIRMH